MKKILLSLLAAMISFSAAAADFLDTGASGSPVSFGVRFGLTSASQKTSLSGLSDNVSLNWGMGFTAGAVIDLNVRNYFSVQPGFFFENRSYDYTVVLNDPSNQSLTNYLGHTRSYSFTIPVLASFKFNLSESVKWLAEIGPYFAFGLGGNDEYEFIEMRVAKDDATPSVYNRQKADRDYYGNNDRWQHRSFDWGAKIGTGIKVNDKYSFMIHYMGGLKNLSQNAGWTMKHRSWSFSLGYDF